MASDTEPRNTTVRLTDLGRGEKGRVTDLQGEPALCSRLREMGFCESAVVEKVSGSHTVLCQVCGTRVALNGRAAQNILVEPMTPAAESTADRRSA